LTVASGMGLNALKENRTLTPAKAEEKRSYATRLRVACGRMANASKVIKKKIPAQLDHSARRSARR